MPPGEQLGSMLEDVDIELVCGHDTVVVLSAEYRQLCRQQARYYRVLLETGLRKPFSIDTVERLSQPGEFAAEEARAALVWSRTRAERAFGFAVDLFLRLPPLGQAMLAGKLDEPRARAFVDWTSGLTDAQAEQVCEQLLGEAAQLMVGELIDRIKRACLAIDPDYAEKRYREGVRTRQVRGSRNPDGTANLGGYNQPLDRIAAASEHIDVLARACKRAGDSRLIDYIRSDLFLGLSDGTFVAMSQDEIVAYVLTHPYTEPGDDQEPDGNSGGSKPDRGGRPETGKGGDLGPGHTPNGPWHGGRRGDGRDGSERRGGMEQLNHADAADQPDHADPARADAARQPDLANAAHQPDRDDGRSTREPLRGPTEVDNVGLRSGEARPARSPDAAMAPGLEVRAAAAGTMPPASAGRTRAVPELRIELSTLLGQNDHPGEIPPWGPIAAAKARELVSRMGSAEWRYVLCGGDGRAVAGGLLRARLQTNGAERSRRDVHRGGIVEIAVPMAEFGRLAAGQPMHGPWRAVLVELARQVEQAGRRSQVRPSDPDTHRGDPDANSRDPDFCSDDPTRRTPGAALRRWVQLRDRQCTHPSCRAPARRSDQDHRVRFAEGGPTVGDNLSPPCRHDHRLKDEGNWVTTLPEAGLTMWTSPLGHRYQSRPPPIIVPLPQPYRDPDNRWDPPAGRYEYGGWPVGCDCDEPCAGCCDNLRPILPPSPMRIPDQRRTVDPGPTPIFDPDDRPAF